MKAYFVAGALRQQRRRWNCYTRIYATVWGVWLRVERPMWRYGSSRGMYRSWHSVQVARKRTSSQKSTIHQRVIRAAAVAEKSIVIEQQFPSKAQRMRIIEISECHGVPLWVAFHLVKMGLPRRSEEDALVMREVTGEMEAVFVFARAYKSQLGKDV